MNLQAACTPAADGDKSHTLEVPADDPDAGSSGTMTEARLDASDTRSWNQPQFRHPGHDHPGAAGDMHHRGADAGHMRLHGGSLRLRACGQPGGEKDGDYSEREMHASGGSH
jgi:hypothetical protein